MMRKMEDHSFENDDDIHNYFSSYGEWDWCDIYREGIRMLNHHFDMEIEDYSPIADVISGVAAQSKYGAYASVAAMLGIDADSLEMVASEWYEKQHELPPPINLEELPEKIAEWRKELESFKSRKP
jgi:hypothetical protein